MTKRERRRKQRRAGGVLLALSAVAGSGRTTPAYGQVRLAGEVGTELRAFLEASRYTGQDFQLFMNGSPVTPGVHSDGVQYLFAAESFVQRQTLAVPAASWRTPLMASGLTHYPPGFSLLIAIPVAIGIPARAAALLVIALSAGVAVAFSFLLATRLSGWAGGTAAAVLLMATPGFALLHMAVWSEPTFLAVTTAMVFSLVRWPRRTGLHGALAALGLVIRYVGVAGTAVVVTWALLQSRTKSEAIRRASIAGAPSLLFALAWWRTIAAVDSGTVRRLGWYPGVDGDLDRLGSLIVDWLVPSTTGGGMWAAALVGLAAGTMVVMASARGNWSSADDVQRFATCGLLYIVMYCGVLVGARTFLDPRIPFDFRLLSPVLALLTIGVGAAAGSLIASGRGLMAVAVVAALLTWTGLSTVEIGRGVRAVNAQGLCRLRGRCGPGLVNLPSSGRTTAPDRRDRVTPVHG